MSEEKFAYKFDTRAPLTNEEMEELERLALRPDRAMQLPTMRVRRMLTEITQLRSDLARVTGERDEARRHRDEALGRANHEARERDDYKDRFMAAVNQLRVADQTIENLHHGSVIEPFRCPAEASMKRLLDGAMIKLDSAEHARNDAEARRAIQEGLADLRTRELAAAAEALAVSESDRDIARAARDTALSDLTAMRHRAEAAERERDALRRPSNAAFRQAMSERDALQARAERAEEVARRFAAESEEVAERIAAWLDAHDEGVGPSRLSTMATNIRAGAWRKETT